MRSRRRIFGVFGGLRRPKGRGVGNPLGMGGRTLTLNTNLTEEDFKAMTGFLFLLKLL